MSGTVLQVRDIHGNVHLGNDNRAALWAYGSAVMAVFLLLVALVVLAPEKPGPSPAEPTQAAAGQSGSAQPTTTRVGTPPQELRVTADLSVNDRGPWAYVSDSPDFPDPELRAELSKPRGLTQPALIKRVRTTPGAFPEKEHLIRLHLEGPADHAVRVIDIRPVIRNKRDVPRGTSVATGTQGEESSTEVLLLLDEPFPVMRESVGLPAERQPGGPYFPGHTINLANGETSEVVITARAYKHAYEYDLVVAYQIGDQIKEMLVNDGGQPFRVSGRLCIADGRYPYDSRYGRGDNYELQTYPANGAPRGLVDKDCAP
ncbi:hypothetical protein [Lentzea sp.]|uniref:hypothetical protein n=1 Tax=Lentzea sp. TaxID=56099 RepID=UPI002B63A192|nr:hypothetical protein [Lentzea sp.]HUQ54929.1 hypothetical protein [Lentzea sp.]